MWHVAEHWGRADGSGSLSAAKAGRQRFASFRGLCSLGVVQPLEPCIHGNKGALGASVCDQHGLPERILYLAANQV